MVQLQTMVQQQANQLAVLQQQPQAVQQQVLVQQQPPNSGVPVLCMRLYRGEPFRDDRKTDVENVIEQIKIQIEVQGELIDPQKHLFWKSTLDGIALAHITGLEQTTGQKTAEQIKQELRNMYTDRAKKQKGFNTLRELRQTRKIELRTFNNHWKQAMADAGDLYPQETQLMQAYAIAFNHDNRSWLIDHPKASVEEVMTMLEVRKANKKTRDERHHISTTPTTRIEEPTPMDVERTKKKKWCTKCKMINHNTKNC